MTRWTALALLALIVPKVGQGQATGRITGIVTAEGGRPVNGVSVQVVGSQLGAVTNDSGRYSISAVPAGTRQVQARRIGFTSATLPVFRDFTYPLGVGSFDQFAFPLRAFVKAVERRGERLEIQADVESVEKAGRSYKILRGPFTPRPAGESTREPLAAHWVVLGPGDEVVAAGAARDVQGGRLIVDLAGRVPPGSYRVALALALNGNLVNPEVKVVPYRVGD